MISASSRDFKVIAVDRAQNAYLDLDEPMKRWTTAYGADPQLR